MTVEVRGGLIGREHPVAVLRAEIRRGIESHGGLVLVTGEAGIGKTSLVAEAAEEARRLGALVLGGSCWDSGSAPGYWPWVQVMRGLRRGVPAEEWAAAREAGGDSLAALLGEGAAGEGADGFRLYDAVTSALVTVSQQRPVVVVLDDLHWADAASLRLLEFAARHTWFERLVLIGTYRDVEVEATGHPLRPLLAPLLAKATTITLTGLGRAQVAELMARTAGEEPSAELVDEVHRRTGGNPFFIEETARLWRGGGSLAAIPPGVRDTLTHRLSLLAAPVVDLLATAAVLGREFHRQVLAAAAGAPVAHVDRLLDQAVAARLVRAGEDGGFAFAHDLVRETLYGMLDEGDPARRHAAVVHAIDAAPDLAAHVLPADLARHAYLGGDHVEPARAVEHLLAAARRASTRLAADEAVGHYRRALERAAALGPARCALIAVDLGRELYHWGDIEGARRCHRQAAGYARQTADPEILGRIALSVAAMCGRDDTPPETTELLAQAYDELVGQAGAPGERPPPHRMIQELSVYFLAAGRRGDDDEALLFALWARHDAIWRPGTARERLALIDELAAVARRTGETEPEAMIASLRWVTSVELGDPRYEAHFQELLRLGERSDLPRNRLFGLIDGAIVALMRGRLGEAEDLIGRIAEHNREFSAHEFAGHMLDHLRWAIRLWRGEFDALQDTHRALHGAGYPCPDLVEALTAVRRGDVGTALRHLNGRDEPYDGEIMPLWLRFQAEAAAASGDPALCARARAAIEPYAGQWAVSLYGWDVSGPMSLWMGVADAGMKRWDRAVEEFTAARESAELLRARPWVVEAELRLAQALLSRAAPGDADRALALLDSAEAEASALGLHEPLERIRRVRRDAGMAEERATASGQGRPPSHGDSDHGLASGTGSGGRFAASGSGAVGDHAEGSDRVTGSGGRFAASGSGNAGDHAEGSDRVVATGTFRRGGAVWTLDFAGRTVHLPDAKGLRDLHTLLSSPGADVPAVRLLDPEGGEAVVAARRMGGDPVLDEQAKARYRRRLAELDEEIDRAVEWGDDDRAAALDAERAALLTELRTAAGLGGRTRRLGDEAERARKTVTARIRDILRKLDTLHPELAAHLRATVSTGSACRYRPDHDVRWRL
jgi:tetratricopeptide (TPR) repeat protein